MIWCREIPRIAYFCNKSAFDILSYDPGEFGLFVYENRLWFWGLGAVVVIGGVGIGHWTCQITLGPLIGEGFKRGKARLSYHHVRGALSLTLSPHAQEPGGAEQTKKPVPPKVPSLLPPNTPKANSAA